MIILFNKSLIGIKMDLQNKIKILNFDDGFVKQMSLVNILVG